MEECYIEVAKNFRKIQNEMLDRVKKGYWFFLTGEKITKEDGYFIHSTGLFTWKNLSSERTPFVASIEGEFTHLTPVYEPSYKHALREVYTNEFCGISKINKKDNDYLVVSTEYFLIAMDLEY